MHGAVARIASRSLLVSATVSADYGAASREKLSPRQVHPRASVPVGRREPQPALGKAVPVGEILAAQATVGCAAHTATAKRRRSRLGPDEPVLFTALGRSLILKSLDLQGAVLLPFLDPGFHVAFPYE